METRGEHTGIKDVIDRQMALITLKHGENGAKLANALLMVFAANSTNDPYKDKKIAETLASKVRKGEFLCDKSQGIPSFGWINKKGKEDWLFTTVSSSEPDIYRLFRPVSRIVRTTSIVQSELTDQIIITASAVHKALGMGPVYEHKSNGYHVDLDYRNLYGHLTRTARNVAMLLPSEARNSKS